MSAATRSVIAISIFEWFQAIVAVVDPDEALKLDKENEAQLSDQDRLELQPTCVLKLIATLDASISWPESQHLTTAVTGVASACHELIRIDAPARLTDIVAVRKSYIKQDLLHRLLLGVLDWIKVELKILLSSLNGHTEASLIDGLAGAETLKQLLHILRVGLGLLPANSRIRSSDIV